jgi:hypothetical protein
MAKSNLVLPNFDPSTLLERIADIDPGAITMSLEDGLATKLFRVKEGWNKRYDAAMFLLGYSWVEYPSGADPILRREIPFRHPDYPNFYCKKVRLGGQFYKGQESTGENLPEWKRADETTKYKDLLIDCEFGPLPYVVADDDEITTDTGVREEWERFTRVSYKPATDVLSVEGAAFKYHGGDADGVEVSGSLAIPERKADLKLRWCYVPQEWTHNGERPVKLQSKTGFVNETEFMGYPAGTLLYDSYEIERVDPPFRTNNWSPFRCNHIDLFFKFFDPERGDPNSIRGHNLMPYRADGKYYPIKSVNADPAKEAYRYESYDFRGLFSHWSI